MPIEFDFDAALKGLRAGQDLNGPKGILTPLIKQLTEAALKGELEQHLAQEAVPNRKKMAIPARPLNRRPATSNWKRHGIELGRLSRNSSVKIKRI